MTLTSAMSASQAGCLDSLSSRGGSPQLVRAGLGVSIGRDWRFRG